MGGRVRDWWIFNIPEEKRLNHRIEIIGGVREIEIADMMKLFFQKIRKGKERIN